MPSIPVENKSLDTPVLVPSISSFETQLDPLSALQLQYSLREPVSLVSAYDIRQLGANFEALCDKFRQSSVLLLDSGGYEHSHVVRYSGDHAPSWTFADFKAVCELSLYDFAFSYDYFWCDKNKKERADEFELRLVDEIFREHSFIPAKKLIPVIHLHALKDDRKRLSEDEILSAVTRIASECKSPFIAIPERELGEGILQRYQLTKKICDA